MNVLNEMVCPECGFVFYVAEEEFNKGFQECPSCKYGKKEEEEQSGKSKVAILTNFMDFNPGYSLTGIVQDQCKMLHSQGHSVHLYVNSKYNMAKNDKSQFVHDVSHKLPKVELFRDIPFAHLKDYQSIKDITEDHKEVITKCTDILIKQLSDVNYVFTHDFIFTGWFLPYGIACIEASRHLPNTRFLHWVHSTPSANSDWWNFKGMGQNHRIIFPNNTEQVRVAEQYKTMPQNVSCIHHIKDLRTWNDFGIDANDFIEDHPAVMNADIVQIYPASSDRFSAKRLEVVMEIFSNFKEMGKTVCLVCANQWATGRQRKEDVNEYVELAKKLGLEYGKEFIFTSEWNNGKYDTGIPKRMLRELSNCSNMFIFPTREESFGLVGVEMPLSTSCITITNKSLQMMDEIHGGFLDSFHFGSFCHNFAAPDQHKYLKDVALLIHNAFLLNKSVLHRTFLRQRYNWNSLYLNEYLPAMDF